MKKIKFLLLFALILAPTVSAYAQKAVFSREYPRMMTSVRAMGMGNAFYGVSDDKYAGFYNPAGLAMNKNHWTLDLIPLTVGANTNLADNAGTLGGLFLGGSTNENAIIKALNGIMGQYNNVAPISFFPAFTMNNWSVGIFVNSHVNMLTYGQTIPTLAVKAHADAGAIVTYAHSFLKDKSLHFGVSLVGFYRMGFTGSYEATDFVNGNVDFGSELNNILNNTGWGILANVGVMYELPWLREQLNARVGLSVNDLGYTDFAPGLDPVTPTVNLSVAISPKWEFITSNIVIDFNDILVMNGTDKDYGKRVNIGAEVGFWNHIFLRAGLHQGYLTAGVGLDIWALRLNYAYYTEELGAYAGQFKDSRHAIELVIGWNQQKKK